jgi:cell division protein FtsQ
VATQALNPRRPAGRALAGPRSRRPAAGSTAVLRRRLIAAAIVLVALYGGYMLWFRNLSWFQVHDVTIKGATTDEREIKSAVEQVAGDMTTLHLNDDQLRNAVARFPTVAAVGASTSFPHGLTVTITERLPVGIARIGGREIAVSADGYLLPGASVDSKTLPHIGGAAAHGPRLESDAAAQAAIIGAAPQVLRDRLTASSWDEQRGGVVLRLKGGPELRFGDGTRAADKWQAAVAVLSSPERGSPSYLDVSVPDRPVAGG